MGRIYTDTHGYGLGLKSVSVIIRFNLFNP